MPGGKKQIGDEEQAYRRRLAAVLVELRAIGNSISGPQMSQAFLAEALVRSEAALSRWETGKATPTAFDLAEVARVFDLPDDALRMLLRPPERAVSPVRQMLADRAAAGARKGQARPGQAQGAA